MIRFNITLLPRIDPMSGPFHLYYPTATVYALLNFEIIFEFK